MSFRTVIAVLAILLTLGVAAGAALGLGLDAVAIGLGISFVFVVLFLALRIALWSFLAESSIREQMKRSAWFRGTQRMAGLKPGDSSMKQRRLAEWIRDVVLPLLTLSVDLGDQDGSAITANEASALRVGDRGETMTPLRPVGRARMNGEIYEVFSSLDQIDAGIMVRVIAIDGRRVVVVPADGETA